MEKAKNFMKNISQTGWIIISAVIVIILLVLIGFLLAKNGKSVWPFFSSNSEEVVLEDDEFVLPSMSNDNSFINNAEKVVLSVKDMMSLRADNSVAAASLLARGTNNVKVAVISNQKLNGVTLHSDSCGNVINVITSVPKRSAILNESIDALFGDRIISDVMPGNVIAQNNELLFDRAVIENGEALVFLNGSFNEGECNKANVINQIKYTALNFNTVNSVAVFLNGEEL